MQSSDNIAVKSSLSFQVSGHNLRRHGRNIIYNWIRKRRHSRNNVYGRIRTPEPVLPEPQKNITINVEVDGFTVYVTFGPVDLYVEHVDVCLSKFDPSVNYAGIICAAMQTVPKGKNVAVFQNVSVDQYKVVVQIDDSLFKSKAFTVIAKKPVEDSLSHLTILSITMACLVVITGTTTLYFCILRKRGHCLSVGLTRGMCNCYRIYQKASYVPNNVTEDEEDYEVVPVFYPESELFKQAVHECCSYLSKWSKCNVNLNRMNETNSSILPERNQNRPSIALIFLSSKMMKFLDEMMSRSNIVELTSLQTNTFQELYDNASKKIFVGLRPVSDTSLHLKDKLELTKHVTQRNQLEINTHSLNELIGLLKVDTTVESGWCSHDELFSLLNAIRLVPSSDLNSSGNQCRKEIVNIPETIPTTVCFHSEDQNDLVPCCTFCKGNDSMHVPLRQKEMDTLIWAQSVQCSTRPCPNNCLNSQRQGSANFIISNQFGAHGEHFIPDDVGPDESVSVYHEAAVVARNQEHCLPVDALPPMKWDPPDWDAESDSFSIIGQRQREIYNDYKASFGDTKL